MNWFKRVFGIPKKTMPPQQGMAYCQPQNDQSASISATDLVVLAVIADAVYDYGSSDDSGSSNDYGVGGGE